MHEPHELALIFPPMAAEQYDDLRRDIAAHGLRDPVTLLEGKVLDGVHRERACEETGQEPAYVTFADGDDAVAFVTSRNLTRRHLTIGQRADLALKLLPHYEAERPQGRHETDPSHDSKRAPQARKRAADAVGLGETTVAAAKRIKQEDPDLWGDVVAGKSSVDAADRKVRKRKGEQPAPKNRGDRAKNWNGKTNPKRERELQAERRGNYNELLRLSLDMNRACSIIESYRVEDFDLDAETLALVDTFHDDLITLASWVDRAVMATQGWLSDVDTRRKIAALRNTTGRSPEEAASFNRLADKLERKLESQLPVGA